MSSDDTATPKITRENFLGFRHAGYSYYRVKDRNGQIRVRTFSDPQNAVQFVADSIGRSPGLVALTRDGDVPLLDQDAKLLPGVFDGVRALLSNDEASLLLLFMEGECPKCGEPVVRLTGTSDIVHVDADVDEDHNPRE